MLTCEDGRLGEVLSAINIEELICVAFDQNSVVR